MSNIHYVTHYTTIDRRIKKLKCKKCGKTIRVGTEFRPLDDTCMCHHKLQRL